MGNDGAVGAGYTPGVDTSKEAAEAIVGIAGNLRYRLCRHIERQCERGSTTDEAVRATGIDTPTASTRISELQKLGFVVDSGQRRRTRSNRNARVWVSTKYKPAQTGPVVPIRERVVDSVEGYLKRNAAKFGDRVFNVELDAVDPEAGIIHLKVSTDYAATNSLRGQKKKGQANGAG